MEHPSCDALNHSPQAELLEGVMISDVVWCQDRLTQGLREGLHRQEFISALEADIAVMLGKK